MGSNSKAIGQKTGAGWPETILVMAGGCALQTNPRIVSPEQATGGKNLLCLRGTERKN
jgi:hypothetical protein